MNNVILITDKDTGSKYKIPTEEYIKNVLKDIEDIIITHINNSNSHNVNNTINDISHDITNVIKINTCEDDDISIYAKDIISDSTHRFITDIELAQLKQKVTFVDLELLRNEMLKTIKSTISAQYDNILNTPNATNILHLVTDILNSDELVENIFKSIAHKIDIEDFKDHINSGLHITNKDRVSLDKLLEFISLGCCDWDAPPDTVNSIANKPTSMPANGGNADTVDNHGINDLLNKQSHSLIIGVDGFDYTESEVDLFIDDDLEEIDDVIKNYIDNLPMLGGSVRFREGMYQIGELSLAKNDNFGNINISGCGKSTIIYECNLHLVDNISLRDVALVNSNVYIYSNCEISNVYFENCNIYMVNASNNIIKNCRMINGTKITYKGSFLNNIVSENFVNQTTGINYIGGGNFIGNNIVI